MRWRAAIGMLVSLSMERRYFLGVLLAGMAVWARGAGEWPLADKERFLETAAIESEASAGKGITGTRKAMLSDGRRTHAAHIQFIDVYMPLFKGKDGSEEKDFKDSWKFNVAAYRLAKLLNLTDMVPVSVARVVDGKNAAVSWWVDDVMMDERERVTRGITPPDMARWNRQMDTIRIFDQLIYNMDRSQENLLICKDWSVWMIDHTRAFRKWQSLRAPEKVTFCTPALYRSLKGLTRGAVARECGRFLTPDEIDGLMIRRDLILMKLESTGGVRGETATRSSR